MFGDEACVPQALNAMVVSDCRTHTPSPLHGDSRMSAAQTLGTRCQWLHSGFHHFPSKQPHGSKLPNGAPFNTLLYLESPPWHLSASVVDWKVRLPATSNQPVLQLGPS